jgi:uncharacterized membrane protein
MSPELNELLEIALRWAHIFAAIMWVGATYYFTWLDGRFVELEEKAKRGENAEKFVWMVHSGGFYLVEKQKRPQMMPTMLHWFRWEAAFTWLSGILLFSLMYYHGRMIHQGGEEQILSFGNTVALSVGMLIAGWVIYDALWMFCKNELLGIVISYALIVGTAWVSCHYFSPRGAFLQVGAMMGTIMAANVWMRILPPQRRMVAALTAGREPDIKEALRAKGRSKHNSFIVIPVVFMMISQHATLIIGSKFKWVYLSVIVLIGWGAAKIIRRA